MGMLTTLVLLVLLYTDFKWITYLYITWVIYDWDTPLKGGRNLK
jgi:hypothetical protein